MYALDGPEFFKLAFRVAAYGGNLAMRIQYQQHEKDQETKEQQIGEKSLYEAAKKREEQASKARGKPLGNKAGVNVVPLGSQMMRNPDLFEVAKV